MRHTNTIFGGRKRRFGLILTLLACAFASITVAQPQAAKPVKVIIYQNDGKSVSGDLVEATPATVTVKAGPKGDAISVPWSDIKRLSTGMTRAQVVEEFRKRSPDRLCETCKGGGVVDCEHCKGTGIEPATAKDCDKCQGKGTLGDCPKCDAGQMPCPSPCLKASSFSGAKDAEGKRWRQFKGKSGTLRISDAHVGEQVVMENGDPVMKGKCPTCDGKTTVDCTTCAASGERECSTCHRSGKTGPACDKCKAGDVPCTACEGTGMKKAQ